MTICVDTYKDFIESYKEEYPEKYEFILSCLEKYDEYLQYDCDRMDDIESLRELYGIFRDIKIIMSNTYKTCSIYFVDSDNPVEIVYPEGVKETLANLYNSAMHWIQEYINKEVLTKEVFDNIEYFSFDEIMAN